jgi:hypothetical protein
MATNIDWEPKDDLTYGDKTRRTATVLGIPLLFLFLALFQLIVFTWVIGFTPTAIMIGMEAYIIRKTKKMKVPITRLPLYLKERRCNYRRALPRRMQNQELTLKRLARKELEK